MGRQMEGVRIAPSTGGPWEGTNTFSGAHAGNGFLMVDGGGTGHRVSYLNLLYH